MTEGISIKVLYGICGKFGEFQNGEDKSNDVFDEGLYVACSV